MPQRLEQAPPAAPQVPPQPAGQPEYLQPAANSDHAKPSPWQADASEAAAGAPRALPAHLRPAQYQAAAASEPPVAAPAEQPQAEARPLAQTLNEPQPIQPPAATEQRSIPLERQPSQGRSTLHRGDMPPWLSGAASLAIVLGLFLLVAWAVRRGMPKGTACLPSEAVEVLGRANLFGRQQVHLVRCGSKLLLVHISPTSVETLTEITDPAEVERLAAICQHPQASRASGPFRQVLQQFGKRPAEDYMVAQAEGGHVGFDLANFESQIDAVGRRRGELCA